MRCLPHLDAFAQAEIAKSSGITRAETKNTRPSITPCFHGCFGPIDPSRCSSLEPNVVCVPFLKLRGDMAGPRTTMAPLVLPTTRPAHTSPSPWVSKLNFQLWFAPECGSLTPRTPDQFQDCDRSRSDMLGVSPGSSRGSLQDVDDGTVHSRPGVRSRGRIRTRFRFPGADVIPPQN